MLKIPNFRGVYMRNDLPLTIREKESGIINLDDKRGPGTHWTAYVKNGKDITYFDSIGHIKPPLELIKYFRSGGSKPTIRYNFERYQNLQANNCGHLCLQFLYEHA